ncbi:hypothetical protein Droror1_Dr00025468 [Drosera rotundifolia]
MPTWKLLSGDDDDHHRWQISDSDHLSNHPTILNPPNPHSSMTDLLLQGGSRIIGSGGGEGLVMFRSGFGRSVALKRTSIVKAMSILGGEEDDGKVLPPDDRSTFSRPLFQTASGKAVDISPDGIFRAKKLLEMEKGIENSILASSRPSKLSNRYSEENLCHVESKRARVADLGTWDPMPASRASLQPGTDLLKNGVNEIHNGKHLHSQMDNFVHKPAPIKFHTAGGRSISVSEEPLKRAKSLLSDPEVSKIHNRKLLHSQMGYFVQKPAPIKFQTAGGRSISVSGESLMRARSLLGNPEVCKLLADVDEPGSIVSPFKDTSLLDEQNLQKTSLVYHKLNGVHSPKSTVHSVKLGSNLLQKFNSVECVSDMNSKIPLAQEQTHCGQKDYSESSFVPSTAMQEFNVKDWITENDILKGSVKKPLVDITNTTGTNYAQKNGIISAVRQLGMRKSNLPFKRPRTSKFINPMVPKAASGGLNQSTNLCHRRRVSTRYPSHVPRPYIKELLGYPSNRSKLEHLPEQIRRMNPDTAKTYVFHGESGSSLSIEEFSNMLLQCGAYVHHASKKWVANHYKWIVWKLACYERCSSPKLCGKSLTVTNVIEELKYRYEREANHGHLSAVKRILEGDMPPSSLLVVCISAVWSSHSPKIEVQTRDNHSDRMGPAARIQLTDGWYSIDAQLDMPLSRYLAAGKLFVGQKLRICGASLLGWSGPVSPLESQASSVSLFLHANGTYRACWSDRLGLCRGPCIPLAFRCIKGDGGPVPRTLVGVTRIYPMLYREKLDAGRYIVRSKKLEAKSLQLHEQRCSNIIEGIKMDFQKGNGVSYNGHDQAYGEGAKIMKMLDGSAEPEVILAEMTSEQLASLAAYKLKVEETNQLDLNNSIQKALSAAGLTNRAVTPFMRIRVVGLVKKREPKVGGPEEGLITLWNPTEQQRLDLSEGEAYAISGLVPLRHSLNLIYLQARESTIRWQTLTSSEREVFMPFSNPRESILLSRLREIPVSREFDTVALVLHVGDVYIAAHQKRQWVFVTDGSIPERQFSDSTSSLLAISFCAPCIEGDSDLPVNYNLVNSTVGFLNLVMREKDQVNDLWVAEASENSTYHLSFEHQATSHLKHSSLSVQRWVKNSSLTIEILKKKVLNIIGASSH